MILLAFTLLAHAAQAAPLRASDLERAFEVKVATGRAGCTVAFGGRRLDMPSHRDELIAYTRGKGATRAVVKANRDVPHRCIDGVVLTLQRAGAGDIDLVAEGK